MNRHEKNKFLFFSTCLILVSMGILFFYFFKSKHNKGDNFALLIGGGLCEVDNHINFYKNIEYVANSLKKLGYRDKNVTILFFGEKSSRYFRIERDATRTNVMAILQTYARTINSNDTLLIFRSGHGLIELVDKKYGILSNITNASGKTNLNIIGTVSVMRFPDGPLSYIEFEDLLGKIKARQIIVILSQCYSGQFTEITKRLSNTVVVTETSEVEIAFSTRRKDKIWNYEVWPFVKCLFDGLLIRDCFGSKQSLSKAFEYMLSCNPWIRGFPLKADRPLLRESPQIKYGEELTKGAVYID